MAYPKNFNFNEVTVSVSTPSLVSGQNGSVRVPFRSQIMKLGTIIGSAAATADATVTPAYVNAGSTVSNTITGSTITVASTNSYAGQVFTATPTQTVILEEDSGITFAVTGTSTSGGNVTHFAVLREA